MPVPGPLRVALLCDYADEGWPSMELVGEMLARALDGLPGEDLRATRIHPRMPRAFRSVPLVGGSRAAFNADRVLGRHLRYPEHARSLRGGFDVHHVVDHSYAQLVHALPQERTIVTCHDLDTFRCLVEPAREPRGPLFRALARRTLRGLQRAARVTCDSAAVRDEVLRHGIVAPERLVVVPLGVHPELGPGPDPRADGAAAGLLGEPRGPELLSVGSTVERKRLDVVLAVLAAVRREVPEVRLVRVGGALTPAQRALAARLGVEDAVASLPFLEPRVLAAVYRRATLLLQPSEREGFGLPVVEALACGTPVLASDLPVLREVGDGAAEFAPVGDAARWTEDVLRLLREHRSDPARWSARRSAGIRAAGRYSWSVCAKAMASLYREVAAA